MGGQFIGPFGSYATTNYTQTDTASAAAVAAYCSGLTLGSSPVNDTSSAGGTAGTTSHGITIAISASNLIYVMMEIDPAEGLVWASGNWTVRLNVTTAASATSPTWAATYICRLNSSNVSQATIGSLTGQAITISTTGVKSMTVSGTAQTPSSGDKVVVIFAFSNSSSMTAYTPAFTFNQNIDTPFYTTPSKKDQMLSSAVTRASFF